MAQYECVWARLLIQGVVPVPNMCVRGGRVVKCGVFYIMCTIIPHLHRKVSNKTGVLEGHLMWKRKSDEKYNYKNIPLLLKLCYKNVEIIIFLQFLE